MEFFVRKEAVFPTKDAQKTCGRRTSEIDRPVEGRHPQKTYDLRMKDVQRRMIFVRKTFKDVRETYDETYGIHGPFFAKARRMIYVQETYGRRSNGLFCTV